MTWAIALPKFFTAIFYRIEYLHVVPSLRLRPIEIFIGRRFESFGRSDGLGNGCNAEADRHTAMRKIRLFDAGSDAVSVENNSHHIWFDHDSVRDGTDGNLDISNGANFVTVSFTKF